MALLGSKRLHLILTDSRGKGLADLINEINTMGELVEVRIRDGATLRALADLAEIHLKGSPFDVIYIVGGFCNLTYKGRATKLISYEWGDGLDLQNHLVDELQQADTRLKKNFPASKVVFCSLIASVLNKVVNAHATTDENQLTVENAVWKFNETVFIINKSRRTISPSLHHQVHRFCKGRRRAYYHHLADGLHPTEELKKKWASEFIRVMAHN